MPSESSAEPAGDRRSNLGLRRLIDEMLDQLRSAANQELWTPEERSRAEADLARIMASVREEAMAAGRPAPMDPTPRSAV